MGEHAPRELIGTLVDRTCAKLLRRHVHRRPHHDAVGGEGTARHGERRQRREVREVRRRPCVSRGRGATRDTEIEHLHETVVTDHHVLGLDVAVDETEFVRSAERAGDVGDPPDASGERYRPVADERAERASGDKLHGEEGDVVHFADVVDGDGVGVCDAGSRARLAEDARAPVG